MSRAHQYHQPNSPDSRDELDSDIELDLHELGPRNSHEDGAPRKKRYYKGGLGQKGATDTIPLQNIPAGGLRISGRRIRKPNSGLDDGSSKTVMDGIGFQASGIKDSSESQNIGDATPLLQEELLQQSKPSGLGLFGGRLQLPKFISRRSGYKSLQRTEEISNAAGKSSGSARNVLVGRSSSSRYAPNVVSNAKYTPWSFLPITLYNEFSFFINLYFLMISLSQTIPPLRIGVPWTYIVPLTFVLTVTLGKEAFDDIARRRRDAEANKELYTVLRLRDISEGFVVDRAGRERTKAVSKRSRGRAETVGERRLGAIEEEEFNIDEVSRHNTEIEEIRTKSKALKVGDILKLGKDQRVPADVVILSSHAVESAVINIPFQDTTVSKDEEPDLLGPSENSLPPKHPTAETAVPDDLSDKSLPKGEGGGIGETFIRTDQLDGETDWKLRIASPLTQSLDPRDFLRLTIIAGSPTKKVNEFAGSIELAPIGKHDLKQIHPRDGSRGSSERQVTTAPLTIDNTAWANTVIASTTTVLAVIVYTGPQTRQAMSTSSSRSKTGLLEYEINNLTKILFFLTLTLSAVLVGLQAVFDAKRESKWYISILKYLILFSTIIPISLRVNLDLGKTVYAWFIERDHDMPGAVVRTSTIPEDLGRIEYLLSDKTGTLTQNEMDLRKIHVGTVSYANEAMEEVSSYVRQGFSNSSSDVNQPAMLVTPYSLLNTTGISGAGTRTRREIGSRVRDVVLALALCHNVTPTTELENGETVTAYQASSPDEIAIVRWTESVGLRVIHRDRHSIALQSTDSSRVAVRVRILEVFPFTSEGKRMGIIVQFLQGPETQASRSNEIWFYQKGADTVMSSIVAANDWLDEETANMAREGLRTLVVGRRKLSPEQYTDFAHSYKEASLSLQSRDTNIALAIRTHLEHNLELLGVTGVEDKLQRDVKPSLELLRNAGIKIWMLTGDKVETARCVAVSSKLVARSQNIHTITSLPSLARASPTAASDTLSILAANPDSTALLLDGDSLSYFLTHHRDAFISLAVLLPAVIACRCSPLQKADIALLIRAHTKKRVACIGDGGNDVSMIQAADVGVGIVGKEGRQASLAADFSITQFCHLTKLLVWHGRNSYKRSAKLAQFVIHRGLLISVCQTVYSVSTRFEPHGLFIDYLLVGYATVYTQFPVFSLVLDRDVDEALTHLYPELYKELTPGQSLSYRTFFIWLAVSIYQGTLIQIFAQYLVTLRFDGFSATPSPASSRTNSSLLIRDSNTSFSPSSASSSLAEGSLHAQMLSIAYSAIIINELVMVAMEVTTWHWIMVASIVGTAILYIGSVPFLGMYFDLEYVWSWGYVWRVAVILGGSLVPVYVERVVRRTVRPSSYRKVRGV